MNEKIVYQGRLVDKAHFRVFVYSKNGSKHLVESYEDYLKSIEEGFYSENPLLVPRVTKRKYVKRNG